MNRKIIQKIIDELSKESPKLDYIRERDKWTCFTCGKIGEGSQMHAGHFISRVKAKVMFDEKNVHAQCYSCNIWKKGNVAEYADRIINRYGKDEFDRLIRERNWPDK